MAELKTKPTSQNPEEFLKTIEPEEKRKDAFTLLELFKKITGEKPRMWGSAIIGYGMFHYKSERSTQEGDWPLVGFSPRKQNLTLYLMNGFTENQGLLKKLGKHKTSKACLYINKLYDVDKTILSKLIKDSFNFTKNKYK
ncbi:MAG TPA: DUF1801 domain-containing protein [Patescibacteria group bacterium]|nr:DUF1801 domain-containing protein [Patescibacteria group bacterium]